MKGLTLAIILVLVVTGWVYRDRLPIVGSAHQVGSAQGAEAYLMSVPRSITRQVPSQVHCSYSGRTSSLPSSAEASFYSCTRTSTGGQAGAWCVVAASSDLDPNWKPYKAAPGACP